MAIFTVRRCFPKDDEPNVFLVSAVDHDTAREKVFLAMVAKMGKSDAAFEACAHWRCMSVVQECKDEQSVIFEVVTHA